MSNGKKKRSGGKQAAEQPRLPPRFFLAAPDAASPAHILDCLAAACEAGDVASLLIPAAAAKEVTGPAQALGVAVIVAGEARDAARHGADGIQVDANTEDVAAAREAMGNDRFVGAYAASSRHFAMEAAEAGADYIAFDQNGASVGGEPVLRWWSDMMEIPAVAFTPVEPDGLDILLPQRPDFIRPPDAMWQSAEEARRIVAALAQRLGAT